MYPILFLSFAFVPIPKEPTLNNGFYEILRQGEGTAFPCNDGSTLLLGKNLGTQFGKPRIHSQNNDNTTFGIFLKSAAKLWDGEEPRELALIANNIAVRLSGNSIPNPDGTRDLFFYVQGEAAARKIANALNCNVEVRKDPGHRLTAKWVPDKVSYQIGETITLTMELKNTSSDSVTFRIGGSQRGARDNQFRFVAQRSHGTGKGVPDTGDPNHHGGLSWTHTLKPGEVYTSKIELNRWFKFDAPDRYRITGIWELHLEDPNREIFDRGGQWDDLVCGECIVHVENEKQ